jgi:hypothetical protein
VCYQSLSILGNPGYFLRARTALSISTKISKTVDSCCKCLGIGVYHLIFVLNVIKKRIENLG